MITRFRVKNFRSIVDATLDLRYAEGKAPPKWKEAPRLPFWQDPATGDRIVPCLAIFGPNAAGKTNLFAALETLKQSVVLPKVDVRDLFCPNRIVPCSPNTVFELAGVALGVSFTYRLVQSSAGVDEEILSIHGTPLFSVENGTLHDRKTLSDNQARGDEAAHRDDAGLATDNYPVDKLQGILDVECKDESGTMIRPFLNCIGHGYRGLNEDVSRVYAQFARLLVFEDFSNFPTLLDEYCRCSKQDRETALREIVSLLRNLDSDIRGMALVEESFDSKTPGRFDFRRVDSDSETNGTGLSVLSRHFDSEGKEVLFRFFAEESAGTIRLASLLCLMLISLCTGMPLFADEFDRSLHPILVAALVRLFTDRKRNPQGAQLVFTTHCTELLDNSILRLSEVAIASKTLHAGTKVRRLADLKNAGEDIRNVTDFRRNYLAGFYSGIPYPTI